MSDFLNQTTTAIENYLKARQKCVSHLRVKMLDLSLKGISRMPVRKLTEEQKEVLQEDLGVRIEDTSRPDDEDNKRHSELILHFGKKELEEFNRKKLDK